jgi:hypothetical protein
MTDFLQNIHTAEKCTAEKCTARSQFKAELDGIVVEPALIAILYDFMGFVVCATVEQSLLAYLQRNGIIRLRGFSKRWMTLFNMHYFLRKTRREIVIKLSEDKSNVAIVDYDEYLHSNFGERTKIGEQYNATVYAVACMLVHGELGSMTVLQTDFVSGLREEHHFRPPYWWYDPNDSYLIGNKILALLFP